MGNLSYFDVFYYSADIFKIFLNSISDFTLMRQEEIINSLKHDQYFTEFKKVEEKLSRSVRQMNPYLKILEQPRSEGFRFRYECEGRPSGSIVGEKTTETDIVYPKIKVSFFHMMFSSCFIFSILYHLQLVRFGVYRHMFFLNFRRILQKYDI